MEDKKMPTPPKIVPPPPPHIKRQEGLSTAEEDKASASIDNASLPNEKGNGKENSLASSSEEVLSTNDEKVNASPSAPKSEEKENVSKTAEDEKSKEKKVEKKKIDKIKLFSWIGAIFGGVLLIALIVLLIIY